MWKDSRNGGLIPFKHAIDPTKIPRILGFVWMYQYNFEIGDFTCRLAGEDINAAWGRSIKGERLSSIISAESHHKVIERWRRVIDVPLIEYGSAMEHPIYSVDPQNIERLLLPVASTTKQPDYVLGISLYRLSPVERESAPPMAAEIIEINCSDV